MTDSLYATPAVGYAPWAQRAGGLLIDYIPYLMLDIIAVIAGSTAVYSIVSLIGLAVWGYNRWYLAGTTGQSWGKKALGLKLVSEDAGEPIGPLMAFVRDICHALDSLACFVGWLFPLWDIKRQTFSDKIIRTIVVPA